MLILKQNTAASVPTPAAGKGTIFLSDSDVLSVKKSSGAVESFPTVGGANTQVIFNDDAALSGNANFTFDKDTDILTVTGNIGATNVLRTGNKKIAAATLFLDCFKGVFAVLIAKYSSTEWVVSISAMAAVMGHIFPVWLKFKGGKGVATALAVYWCIYWPLGLFASISWLFVFAVDVVVRY